MVGGEADSKRKPLNPNWAQLQCLLSATASGQPGRRRLPVKQPAQTPSETVLGKRKERSDSGNGDSTAPVDAASVLTPANDDCSLTHALAMDCEMVGVGAEGNKSALGRVTLVNTWGNIVYDEFVRPLERIVDFRTAISGIRPKNMRNAKDFRIVQNKVADLIKGRILVGHALRNDFKVLLLSHPRKDIRDTAEYRPLLREGQHRRALRHLAHQILGVNIQQKEHCSIEDARAAMLIYLKNKKDWEKSVKDQLRSRKKLTKQRSKKEEIL